MPALAALQGLDARMTPTFGFGIASPCSTCTNRNSLPGADGTPACPRAVLDSQKQDSQTNGVDFSSFEHLTLTGLEANPFATDSPGSYANPVYDAGRNSIYIWVARLVDNPGEYDSENNLVVPPLTDPSFLPTHASQIKCYSLPVVPADTLAQYYSRGRIKEGDQVLITALEGQQLDSDNVTPAVYGGVATRLALHQSFPVTSRPVKDDHPRGT